MVQFNTYYSLTRPTQNSSNQIKIRQSHIEDMYSRYESGMFDPSRANAVSLALRERFGTDVAIISERGRKWVVLPDRKIPLSPELRAWLERAERGLPVQPGLFRWRETGGGSEAEYQPLSR